MSKSVYQLFREQLYNYVFEGVGETLGKQCNTIEVSLRETLILAGAKNVKMEIRQEGDEFLLLASYLEDDTFHTLPAIHQNRREAPGESATMKGSTVYDAICTATLLINDSDVAFRLRWDVLILNSCSSFSGDLLNPLPGQENGSQL